MTRSRRQGAAHVTLGGRSSYAVVGEGTVFDGLAYWATLIGVYLMVGGLMFYSGKEKLFDDNGHPPQGSRDQFKGTFIDTFPGTHAAWIILGVLEFGVFVALLVSLIRLEFLPHPEKIAAPGVGLALALTFACLAFGQTATKQFPARPPSTPTSGRPW